MCFVVNYSEKLVKSDYFGVIICIGGEKSEKSGYSQIKTPISLKIYTKTLNTWDFHHKNSQFEGFHAEYTEKSGHSMRFFRKIGKLALFSIKLTINQTIWVENSEKSDLSGKQAQIFHPLFLQIHVGT